MSDAHKAALGADPAHYFCARELPTPERSVPADSSRLSPDHQLVTVLVSCSMTRLKY